MPLNKETKPKRLILVLCFSWFALLKLGRVIPSNTEFIFDRSTDTMDQYKLFILRIVLSLIGIILRWGFFYFNLRINFYLLRTFTTHLGSFCVVSSFNTFRPNFTSGHLRIGMLSLVTVSPVITALLYIAPRFWPSKPLAGLGRIWNRYLLTMLTWNRRDSTPLSAAPRAPKSDQGWIFWSYKSLSEEGQRWNLAET